jgi:hypothetical protein
MGNAGDTFIGRTARKGRSHLVSFFARWLFWSAIIGTPAWFAGEQLWPHVYKKWGPPMAVFQDDAYWAVLFGDFVSAVIGGAAVAFVGTFRKR